ncbi:MAG: cyanoexosortase B system-associated protein [Phormidesmis sp.]
MSSTLPSQSPDGASQRLPKKAPRKSIAQLAVVIVLALFVAISALPQYVDGWAWTAPPKMVKATRNALQAIPEQGLKIPGWTTTQQDKTKLGGETWSIQQLSAATPAVKTADGSDISSVFLLLRAQTYEGDQPEVEWLDIKGAQHWKTDSHQKLAFSVPDMAMPTSENKVNKSQTVRINGDFLRAWSKDQTYAVLQWYAWSKGGSASPARWFWADQQIQWTRHQRMPWVAVSIWVPIAPFSDIALVQGLAESLAKETQQALLKEIFLAGSAGLNS